MVHGRNATRDSLTSFEKLWRSNFSNCFARAEVEATNDACERHLRPAAIQRKSLPPDHDPGVTNGYRAMWAAAGEADVRTVVDTARPKPGTSVFGTILQTVTA